MTKNISYLYFSFVLEDLLVRENACNSVCSGRRQGATDQIYPVFKRAARYGLSISGREGAYYTRVKSAC